MEIIPIIYTALEIVFVLTLFTLAFSHFYNKVKVKKGRTVKPHKNNPKQLEQKEIIEDHLKPIPRPFTEQKGKSVDEKGQNEDQKKQVGKISTQQKVGKNTEKPKIRNKRLIILKNLADNPKKETKIQGAKKKVENGPSNSLGGEILDKYVEEGDRNMYTLNVKVKKEKPKE